MIASLFAFDHYLYQVCSSNSDSGGQKQQSAQTNTSNEVWPPHCRSKSSKTAFPLDKHFREILQEQVFQSSKVRSVIQEVLQSMLAQLEYDPLKAAQASLSFPRPPWSFADLVSLLYYKRRGRSIKEEGQIQKRLGRAYIDRGWCEVYIDLPLPR